ncbi:MAG: hypothetical protein HOB81_01240, partial [Flavobacteriaceae bacterium]|nr:hypothetical protein [Flavobacteriaceae bacterium]
MIKISQKPISQVVGEIKLELSKLPFLLLILLSSLFSNNSWSNESVLGNCNMSHNEWFYCDEKKYKPLEGGYFDSNSNKQGKFIHKFKNGDVYEGEWKNDLKQGYGKYSYANGDIYEGEWKNDLKQGYGKYSYANGDIYEGEWTNDAIDGIGLNSKHHKNGLIWTKFSMKNRKKHGKWTFWYKNGQIQEEASYKDDSPIGKRTIWNE